MNSELSEEGKGEPDPYMTLSARSRLFAHRNQRISSGLFRFSLLVLDLNIAYVLGALRMSSLLILSLLLPNLPWPSLSSGPRIVLIEGIKTI